MPANLRLPPMIAESPSKRPVRGEPIGKLGANGLVRFLGGAQGNIS